MISDEKVNNELICIILLKYILQRENNLPMFINHNNAYLFRLL